MYIDRRACDAFWRSYLATRPMDHPHRAARPDAFGFGGEAPLADTLADLVLSGRKRATTSLPVEFTSQGEPRPRAGDLSIVVFGNGKPAAIIERTQVEEVPFDEVGQAYATIEGEGDGSLRFWRDAHAAYFAGVASRCGVAFDGGSIVICQTFDVVWT